MAAVHALGHPSSPMPQTSWDDAGRTKGGAPTVPAAMTAPLLMPPNCVDEADVTRAGGNKVVVTWALPSVYEGHGAATEFALRYNLAGTGRWITVPRVSNPYDLTGLPPDAAIDIQVQATNAAGVSTWSATSTLAGTTPSPPNDPATWGSAARAEAETLLVCRRREVWAVSFQHCLGRLAGSVIGNSWQWLVSGGVPGKWLRIGRCCARSGRVEKRSERRSGE
jgi:Fibronectin type III domain